MFDVVFTGEGSITEITKEYIDDIIRNAKSKNSKALCLELEKYEQSKIRGFDLSKSILEFTEDTASYFKELLAKDAYFTSVTINGKVKPKYLKEIFKGLSKSATISDLFLSKENDIENSLSIPNVRVHYIERPSTELKAVLAQVFNYREQGNHL
jgi:hypothetical protein